jgi:hypothetical protein
LVPVVGVLEASKNCQNQLDVLFKMTDYISKPTEISERYFLDILNMALNPSVNCRTGCGPSCPKFRGGPLEWPGLKLPWSK